MAKKADKYFITDPWMILEDGFDGDYGKTAESVFSLGNEYMGVRGYFEEGYSGSRLTGSYFNGVYERKQLEKTSYKGIITSMEFMVNAADYLYCRIRADGELLDLNKSRFTGFKRMLDMRSGLLTRSFLWHTESGSQIKLTFKRLLSMVHDRIAGQWIELEAVEGAAQMEVLMGNDFSVVHQSNEKCFWRQIDSSQAQMWLAAEGETVNTGHKLFSGHYFYIDPLKQSDVDVTVTPLSEEKLTAKSFSFTLKQSQGICLSRIVENVVQKGSPAEAAQYEQWCKEAQENAAGYTFAALLKENELWWKEVWEHSDIQIMGDEDNQQGIRFCIFQMFQTYHGAGEKNNIGAKGLTGEAYNGNAFWDTEVYCLPFFLFNNKEAARKLLQFRYATLAEAKLRADELDCKGAFYPIATISGKECCNLWQHASLQLQPSTAVAYGIWLYVKMTGDEDFLKEQGLEMLTEVCRMLANRGDWSADRKKFGFYCVMGPDEFQMMVNHNCYTNYMGKFTFEFTLSSLKKIKESDETLYCELLHQMGLSRKEMQEWEAMAANMYLPVDAETGIYEQHEGFFELPHVDVDAIPVTDFPLYHNWSYDRIYRNDMIKQPDVLMFMLMFGSRFSQEELMANYEYYEPRCIHESSLSPSVHSILASQLGKKADAYEFFRFATRMDLDNYNRNSDEGLHTTSIAAAWMNIVYGFGGMRCDADCLSFHPALPDGWDGYSFRITYFDAVVEVCVDHKNVKCHIVNDGKAEVVIYGKSYQLTEEITEIELIK